MRLPSPSLIVLLAACALVGCQVPPAAPTWADVAPIMAAHCVRCHGAPAIGGAPPTFRLDRYDDTTSAAGTILGAAAMAEWIAERTADGSMPPRAPLSEYETELLANWYATRPPYTGTGPLPTPVRYAGPRRGAPPQLTASVVDSGETIAVTYLLRDPDSDLVVGELSAARGATLRRLGELHSGRGAVVIDPLELAPGAYELVATLDDSTEQRSQPVGALVVGARSPSPPRVALAPASAAALADGSYLAKAELPFSIELSVRDADTPNLTLTVTLVDERAPEVAVERVTRTVAAGTSTLAVGSAATAPGPIYRVIAEVSDGTSTHRVQSGRFRIASATTTDSFSSISAAVLGPHCYGCHASFPRVPGLALDFTRYRGDASAPGAFELRRRIYQRAVAAQTMPPGAARRRGNELSAEARERLAAWLFAGAPERAPAQLTDER